jgi:esterase/lipase superfamily enzyme
VAELQQALAAEAERFTVVSAGQAGDEGIDALLLAVTAEGGVSEEIRDPLRGLLWSDGEVSPLPIVAFLAGVDRVPDEQRFILDLIELELRGTVADLGLAGESLAVIRGSVPELAAAMAAAPERHAAFRMAIGDLVPTRRGTVVMGRIAGGRVRAGEEVEIAAGGRTRTARVRGVMRDWDLVPEGGAGEEVGLFLEKIRMTDFLGAQALVRPAPAAAASAEPPPQWVDETGCFVVPVYYATDRNRTAETAPRLVFGAERGELTFGVAEVSLPRSRRRNDLPAPSWWRVEPAEDLSRHVVLLDVAVQERAPFLAELRRTLRRAETPEILVFLHGYDVTFEDAARHAAQLANDLDFPGVPLLYSWPSAGQAHRYIVDESHVEWTRVHVAELLRFLLAESGAQAVHVLAHGMGSRALARALGDLDGTAGLRQIVFAAPDIDRDTFLGLVPRFQGRAERCTLYGSSEDRDLRAARIVHSRPRAGESGEALAVADGIDTVDAAAADTSLQPRAGEPTILPDIAFLLRHGLGPERRAGLSFHEGRWLFQPILERNRRVR